MTGTSEYGCGRPFAVRLTRGQDLRLELLAVCRRHGIKAGAIVSLVGSLDAAALRFGGKEKGEVLRGPFEIVSATGTCGSEGLHVHLALANERGELVGGHLCEGSRVATTVELVLLDLSAWFSFERELDERTGARELRVRHAGGEDDDAGMEPSGEGCADRAQNMCEKPGG